MMVWKAIRLKEKLDRLLVEPAQVEVELSHLDGTIRGVPHHSVIEGHAHELGRRMSRQVQVQLMNEREREEDTDGLRPLSI